MRVNSITPNTQNRNQTPSFGMNLSYDKAFQQVVGAMNAKGTSAKEITSGLTKLMNDISDTVTLTFKTDAPLLPAELIPRAKAVLTEYGKEILSVTYAFDKNATNHMDRLSKSIYNAASYLDKSIPMKNPKAISSFVDTLLNYKN